MTNATSNAALYQCCSGLCIDLLTYLSEKIGFEYDLFQVEDKKFGAYDAVSWKTVLLVKLPFLDI